ncbi:MAG: transporter [Beijerinckiaceae bacterium]|nr:transporter [Beijerinckiaceae bacterium]
MMKFIYKSGIIALVIALSAQNGQSQSNTSKMNTNEEELAQDVATPSPEFTSIQMIYDFSQNLGRFETGQISTLTIIPTIPVKINQDWNVISRTKIPIVRTEDIVPRYGVVGGLTNVQQTFLLSPNPKGGNLIWGIGPSFFLPTTTDRRIGSYQTGAGPAIGFLQTSGHWVFGLRMTQIWHAAGPIPFRGGQPLNFFYAEPLISYTTDHGWTYAINAESVYDWSRDKWLLPFNFIIEKLIKTNSYPISLGVGVRYYAASTKYGPKGWGVRLTATVLKSTDILACVHRPQAKESPPKGAG